MEEYKMDEGWQAMNVVVHLTWAAASCIITAIICVTMTVIY